LTFDQKRTRLDISRYLLSHDEDEYDFIYPNVNEDINIGPSRRSRIKNKQKKKICNGRALAHPLRRNLRGCHQQGR
jgi:hypothetical protein